MKNKKPLWIILVNPLSPENMYAKGPFASMMACAKWAAEKKLHNVQAYMPIDRMTHKAQK